MDTCRRLSVKRLEAVMTDDYIKISHNGPFSAMSTARLDCNVHISNSLEILFRDIAIPRNSNGEGGKIGTGCTQELTQENSVCA